MRSPSTARVDSIAAELGVFPKVYLQANTANEAGKGGFSPAELERQIDSLLGLQRLEVLGLMGIPPVRDKAEDGRADFQALRELRDARPVSAWAHP